MIRTIKFLAGGLLAAMLVACGGGGGSPGVTSGTGNNSTPTTVTPTVTLSLVDASNAAVSNNTVTPGSQVFVRATLKDENGAAVPNKLVAFTSTSGLISFTPTTGQVLTDSTGVARVQVAPASSTTVGADTITATATIGTTAVTKTLDVQTSPVNVVLSNLTPTSTTLTAFQATPVTVNVSVGGQPATTTPVIVNFTANCGTFSPTSASTNSLGKAVSTFTATGCVGGPATLTATAVGATPIQTNVTVQAPEPANLLFVSATPSTIFTSNAPSGVKQSTVIFKVVDASGGGITTQQQVQVSLSPASIAAGVTFADSGTTAPKTLLTDVNGQVTVSVKAGAVPTPLTLNAQLVSNSAITASSAGLSVNSGRAVQNFFSLSVQPFNIEGGQYDGEVSTLTIRAADRLAQPVPPGTPVSFIAEGGQVTGSCQLATDSQDKSVCSVSLVSQAFRPANGRITVLSYMDGEEVFVDANGNNKYDVGETFYDMGQPFLDNNENGTLDTGEQKVGDPSVSGSGIGAAPCAAHDFLVSNVASTCDGVWGATRVRARAVIVFSTSFAKPGTFVDAAQTETGFTVTVADQNNNAMPFGTTITATISGGTNCSVASIVPAQVNSTTEPTTHSIQVQKGSAAGSTCLGAIVRVTATTPKGNQTVLGDKVVN